jgi:hypothetical protein
MTGFRLDRRVVAFSAAISLVTGCGSPRAPAALGPALPSATVVVATSNGDLLYVAHTVKEKNGFRGKLSIYSFPQAQPVNTITLPGIPYGTCSDTSGDVWVVVGSGARFDALEYAHAGTKPIASIRIPHPKHFVASCAIDPITGNLAIPTGAVEQSGSQPVIYVWPGAHRGKPLSYALKFSPFACAYDGSGNLLVDGYVGSTSLFDFGELPMGGSAVKNIRINKRVYGYPGGIQWDGEYIGVLVATKGYHRVIYRLSISGKVAHVVDEVRMRRVYNISPFAVADGMVAADFAPGNSVRLWEYPSGGKVVQTVATYTYPPFGITISAGDAQGRRRTPQLLRSIHTAHQ